MKLPLPLAEVLPLRSGLIGRAVVVGGSLLLGQWVLADVMHLPGGGLGLLAAGAGVWLISRGSSTPQFKTPQSEQEWIDRCRQVLDQFDHFEHGPSLNSEERHASLQRVISRDGPQRLGVVCVQGTSMPEVAQLERAMAGNEPVILSMAHPLAVSDGQRCWPEGLRDQDVLLHVLKAPLMAADLLWLQQLPDDQPAWLLVDGLMGDEEAFVSQLPERWKEHLLIRKEGVDLRRCVQPLRLACRSAASNRSATRRRMLADLHRRWQSDLESLRRRRFQSLQQRTQWIVAASVMASPVASVDLLAVAVANGLMIRDMAQIWGCQLSADVMKESVGVLARAALAQGVVEWSSQMLFSLAKLDGGAWLAAGAMQALSAAYLTRVVGRAMADWLALNAGVAQPDLDLLKREAPLLVARAAQDERLDWSGFMQQSRQWLLHPTS